MNTRTTIAAGALLGCAAIMLGHLNSDAVASRGTTAGTFPDVIVGSLHNLEKYGEVNGIAAYAIGTTSCNQGNDYLEWNGNNNFHPTIGQNMYRVRELANGCSRVEMIGMSWLKHGFCALQMTLCGSCDNSGGGGCADRLGWNCSDPYDSYYNGQQSNLGPRAPINASNGYFPYPFSAPGYAPTIGRRLQVESSDINPSNFPASTNHFFVEGMYVHPEDAAACMGFNNASYRPISISGSGNNGFNLNLESSTRQMLPAIFAWEEIDPEVQITEVKLSDCYQSGLNETFFIGSKVCELGGGMWHYEYAVYNLDCDVSISKLSIPASMAENTSQHLPIYHSGSVIRNGEWLEELSPSDGMLTWNSKSFVADPDASAIRWNSMGTFSFDTNSPPVDGEAVVGLFKTGQQITVNIPVPNAEPVIPCTGDLNNDCTIDGVDLASVLGNWGLQGGDLNEDGTTNGQDLAIVLANWGCECG